MVLSPVDSGSQTRRAGAKGPCWPPRSVLSLRTRASSVDDGVSEDSTLSPGCHAMRVLNGMEYSLAGCGGRKSVQIAFKLLVLGCTWWTWLDVQSLFFCDGGYGGGSGGGSTRWQGCGCGRYGAMASIYMDGDSLASKSTEVAMVLDVLLEVLATSHSCARTRTHTRRLSLR